MTSSMDQSNTVKLADLYHIKTCCGDLVTVHRDGRTIQVNPHHLQVGDQLRITEITDRRT